MTEQSDALLNELNGLPAGADEETGMPPLVDGETLPAQDESVKDQLNIGAPAPLSAVAQADALHSTASGGKGYEVVIEGLYYAHTNNKDIKTQKPYTATFVVPDLDAPLALIRNKLLDRYLRIHHKDYAAYRTHAIVKVTPRSPEVPATRNLQYMDRAALISHVQAVRVPLNPADYPRDVDLRQAIIDYTLTPFKFAEREAKRQKLRKKDADLLALNPDLQDVGPGAAGADAPPVLNIGKPDVAIRIVDPLAQ